LAKNSEFPDNIFFSSRQGIMKNVAGLQLSKRDHFEAKLFMNLHLN
jgi:hypothetical protein